MIKIWFPDFYTEAHKKQEDRLILVEELKKFGVDCVLDLSRDCDFIFCAAFIKNQDVKRKNIYNTSVIHYNWDLYPFQINGNPCVMTSWWKEYVEDLKTCKEIWVPSECTITRTIEFTGRDATVIKSSIRTYKETPWDGGYVLDIVRKYEDPNRNLVREACEELNLPLMMAMNRLPWSSFKKLVAGARVIVSAQYEASTGGLTLLEGYALGKRVLLSNSPRHGGIDYFGDRANYFQWDNRKDFHHILSSIYEEAKEPTVENDCWEWVTTEYSERRFAEQIATRLKEIYDGDRC